MEIIIEIIFSAIYGVLVGFIVHWTGSPDWAAVGFGIMAYLGSRIRNGQS